MDDHCECHACISAHCEANPAPPKDLMFGCVDMRLVRYFLCETCGNKRCPRAADHRLACTGSNDPGQLGSLYEDQPHDQ